MYDCITLVLWQEHTCPVGTDATYMVLSGPRGALCQAGWLCARFSVCVHHCRRVCTADSAVGCPVRGWVGSHTADCWPGLKTTRFSVAHGDARTIFHFLAALVCRGSRLNPVSTEPRSVGRQLSSGGTVRASRPLTPPLISVSSESRDCDWLVSDNVVRLQVQISGQFLANRSARCCGSVAPPRALSLLSH